MAASRYAARTRVTEDRSVMAIRRVVERYGGDRFVFADDDGAAFVGFRLERRLFVRIRLPLPARATFAQTPTGRARTPRAASAAFEQATRQAWRALLLVVTAKLEAIAADITTADEEFLAYAVLPSGETVGEVVLPQLAAGTTPLLLEPGA